MEDFEMAEIAEVAVSSLDETATQPECRHHWLIESPHGATSMGICKLCGSQKEFRNSAGDFLWEDEPLSELSYGQWGRSRSISAPVREQEGEEVAVAPAGGATSASLA
jgi:hypothetical protein